MITTTTTKLMLAAVFVLFVAVILGLPHDAFAQSNINLDQQGRQLATQVAKMPKLIALGAYVIGAFFAVRALFALKGFIEAPDDNPITKVLGFAAVSALLIMLPYIITVMTGTIGARNDDVQSSAQSFREQGQW